MYITCDTPIGKLTLVSSDGRLSGIYYPHHWTRPDRSRFGPRSDHGFEAVTEQLGEYFVGARRTFDLETAADGDEFQRRVWTLIAAIPYGETRTYGELAAELGDPRAAREVGAAVGSNPLSVVVPCHRVVGKDGALTGYAGGLKRKRFLLDLEQDQHARLF
jgi:methylated-DNA-[protein]-cysteine S-methyltransferase